MCSPGHTSAGDILHVNFQGANPRQLPGCLVPLRRIWLKTWVYVYYPFLSTTPCS